MRAIPTWPSSTRRWAAATGASLIGLVVPIAVALAQTGADEARRFAEVALAPDGRRLAWVGPPPEGGPAIEGTYVADRRGAKLAGVRRIDLGQHGVSGTEHSLAWSPDGRRLAYLAQRDSTGQAALYVADAATGAADRLTNVAGLLATPRWSPDGTRIAFLLVENPTRIAWPTQPAARDTGVIGHRADVQRIALLEVASRAVRLISPPALYVHECGWSPDGARLVVAGNYGPGDNGWYRMGLYTLALASGDTQELVTPDTQIGRPTWSPDGRLIAYIGGLMSDQSSVGGDVYVVDARGAARNLTPGLTMSVSSLAWPATGRIVFSAYDHGRSTIGTIEPATGQVAKLWHGAESISAARGSGGSLAVASDGQTVAAIRQSFEQPPEIWAGEIGKWAQVSRANAKVVRGWEQSHSVSWTSDQFSPQGWLLAPRDFKPGRRHPMVVAVHGGPAELWIPRWLPPSSLERRLAESGYFVFLPNPRGSLGQGQAFVRGNVRDLGHGDFRDILRGVDAVAERFPIDTARLGITGRSYGGYMAMWAVTQTQRFRAAVPVAGIANWLSYWAQTGIHHWMRAYFGTSVYDDPARYERSAPIAFIKHVRTPTLIIVGERDLECPAPQSLEFWRGVREAGAKSELVIYADEGHVIRQPARVKDLLERATRWFDENLAPPTGTEAGS